MFEVGFAMYLVKVLVLFLAAVLLVVLFSSLFVGGEYEQEVERERAEQWPRVRDELRAWYDDDDAV